jgi:hypothetical protein
MLLAEPIAVQEGGRAGTAFLFKFRTDPPH